MMADPMFDQLGDQGSFSDDEWTYITSSEMKHSFMEGGVNATKEKIEKRMSEWMKIPLNLAIIGQSGAGKSTLINTFRDVTAEDEDGANVGIVQETMEPTFYAHPKHPMLKFWDLPGVGTKEFPREKYLDLVGFKNYDYFLIVTATRFLADDLWIAHEIQKHNKRFIFVRTKIGIDLENIRKSYPKSYHQRQQQMQNQIREDIKKNLGDLYQHENVFLVDSHEKFKFEFNALQERLIETFPEEKRKALLRSLSATSESMIKARVKILRSDVKWAALASAAGGAIPVPGVSTAIDIGILVAHSVKYFMELGLDEESLERLAESNGIAVGEMKEVVGDMHTILKAEGMLSFLKTVPLFAVLNMGEEAVKTWTLAVPLIGAIVGASLSFAQTTYILHSILDRLEPIAVQVLEIAMSENARENYE